MTLEALKRFLLEGYRPFFEDVQYFFDNEEIFNIFQNILEVDDNNECIQQFQQSLIHLLTEIGKL